MESKEYSISPYFWWTRECRGDGNREASLRLLLLYPVLPRLRISCFFNRIVILITFRGMWHFSRQGRAWHVGHLWLIVSNHCVKPSCAIIYSKHYQEYFILQMWPRNLNLSVANSWPKGKRYITEWPSMEFSSFIYNWVYYCKLLLHTSYQILSRRKSALRLMELDWSLPDEDTAPLVTQG